MSSSRSIVLLSACVAVLCSACTASGDDDAKLIAQTRADALIRSVDRLEADLAAGDCPGAIARIDPLRALVDKLPRSTDTGLVSNLTQWVDHLERRVPQDCGAAAEPTTTATPSQTPDETPSPTTTPSPTPSATPDETSTPEPEETETPGPTPDPGQSDDPDTGGAAPDEDGG